MILMGCLGASLMGALPFMLQCAIETARPAEENVVGGLLFIVAMSVAAGLTLLTSTIPVIDSIAIIGGLLVLDVLLFLAQVYYYESGPGTRPLPGGMPKADVTHLIICLVAP